MTEALELKGKEKALEIGTGSGYQTAILSQLADHVVRIEQDCIIGRQGQKDTRLSECL